MLVDSGSASAFDRHCMRNRFFLRLLLCLGLAVSSLGLNSCETIDPQIKQDREMKIAREPQGDYYIGRRFVTFRTRFWGYLRRPGQPWSTAKLVIVNEDREKQPDRLQEAPESGHAHGYDHNFEYKVMGNFTGRTVYDPNADLEVPEFMPTRFELITSRPGYLFDPREKYDPKMLPGREWSGRGY